MKDIEMTTTYNYHTVVAKLHAVDPKNQLSDMDIPNLHTLRRMGALDGDLDSLVVGEELTRLGLITMLDVLPDPVYGERLVADFGPAALATHLINRLVETGKPHDNVLVDGWRINSRGLHEALVRSCEEYNFTYDELEEGINQIYLTGEFNGETFLKDAPWEYEDASNAFNEEKTIMMDYYLTTAILAAVDVNMPTIFIEQVRDLGFPINNVTDVMSDSPFAEVL